MVKLVKQNLIRKWTVHSSMSNVYIFINLTMVCYQHAWSMGKSFPSHIQPITVSIYLKGNPSQSFDLIQAASSDFRFENRFQQRKSFRAKKKSQPPWISFASCESSHLAHACFKSACLPWGCMYSLPLLQYIGAMEGYTCSPMMLAVFCVCHLFMDNTGPKWLTAMSAQKCTHSMCNYV